MTLLVEVAKSELCFRILIKSLSLIKFAHVLDTDILIYCLILFTWTEVISHMELREFFSASSSESSPLHVLRRALRRQIIVIHEMNLIWFPLREIEPSFFSDNVVRPREDVPDVPRAGDGRPRVAGRRHLLLHSALLMNEWIGEHQKKERNWWNLSFVPSYST